VSVPLAVEGDGRWAGLQVVGQFWDDARLLAVAREVREVLGVGGRGREGEW
jgi:Asp-tRNA(Asn)/Glu-tRNA(Gln) amidotransferase A subunit family amidase